VISPAAFLLYAAIVITAVIVIIIRVIPRYGQTHVMVYISVCSLMGSLSVCVSCYPSLNLTFHELWYVYLFIYLFICVHKCTSVIPLLLKLSFLHAGNRSWVSKHLELLWSWRSQEWISYYTPKRGHLPWLSLPV
jgi:hypothetical protein